MNLSLTFSAKFFLLLDLAEDDDEDDEGVYTGTAGFAFLIAARCGTRQQNCGGRLLPLTLVEPALLPSAVKE
jgi:hypothetical protein